MKYLFTFSLSFLSLALFCQNETSIYTDRFMIPRTNTSAVPSPVQGTLIYDTLANSFMYHNGSIWNDLGGGSRAFERIETTVRQNEGYDTDDFVFGRESLPPITAISDTLFFFDKSRGAFRGGQVFNSIDWGEDSLGIYSFAYGVTPRASGNYGSVAMGDNTIASGDYGSTAFGVETIASGHTGATAMGRTTLANGDSGATALGYFTTASGDYGATAMGERTTASGEDGATALGERTTASGNDGATALGYNSEASGDEGATALGNYTTARGNFGAIAIGSNTIATGNSVTVVGTYNDTIVATGTEVTATSPLFIVGNGDNGNESNALVVLKNGEVSFENYTFPIADGSSGHILGTNGSGNVDWYIDETGAFERNGTVVRQVEGYDSDDFVFGREGLPPSTAISDTLFFFDKSKGAFRGGELDNSNNWQQDSLGSYSFSYGRNTKASGVSAIALGDYTDASGDKAIALGDNTTANGNSGATALGSYTVASGTSGATALGDVTTASGDFGATALGYESTASGNFGATALGDGTRASGEDGATAMGTGSTASGDDGATALGYESTASGRFGATAIGESCVASGNEGAIALGVNTRASGDEGAIAIGNETVADGNDGAVAIGFYAKTYGDKGAVSLGWRTQANGRGMTVAGMFNDTIVAKGADTASTNPVFIVGNGNSVSSRSNALVIKKNGEVSYENYAFPITDGTASQILSTDGGGQLSWTSPTTGNGAFENVGNLVRQVADVDADDFIFGRSSLPAGSITDKLFFYDQLTSSFRGGNLNNSSNWNIRGPSSFGYGENVAPTGDQSAAFGEDTEAVGDNSVALGESTRASSFNSLAIGRFNEGNGSPDSWTLTDPIFEIGIGLNDANRVNAVTVSKEGDFHINHSNDPGNVGLTLTNSANPSSYWKLFNNKSSGDLEFYSTNATSGNRKAWINFITGAYSSVSDGRMKFNVQTIHHILPQLLKLEAKSYLYNSQTIGDQRSLGFIAQEAAQLFPELVSYSEEQDMYGINYAGFSVVAIKAIQEQQEVINSQGMKLEKQKQLNKVNEDRITKLEAQIQILMASKKEGDGSID